MNFSELIEQLSRAHAIPLQPTDRGQKMQGDHYHIDYLTYPERPQLQPRLVYNDNNLVFGFGTTEITPLLVAYYVRATSLPRQLAFFGKMASPLGERLLDIFQSPEPTAETFDSRQCKSDKVYTQSITMPEKEFMPFINEHVLFR